MTWCLCKPTCNVYFACQSHISLAHSTKQSAIMDHPSDSVIYYEFSEMFVVQYISVYKRACMEKRWK